MDDWVEIDGVGRPCSNSLGLPLGSTDTEIVGFWRWYGNSQAVDQMGRPLVIYHGGADVVSDFSFEGRWAWASTQVDLAKDYAEMRRYRGGKGGVTPMLVKLGRPFDADRLSRTVRVAEFIGEIERQAGLATGALARESSRLRAYARIEESGPHYSRHDFWYNSQSYFGQEGAALLDSIFERNGFDGARMTELGVLTYGMRSAGQIRCLPQEALQIRERLDAVSEVNACPARVRMR